MPADRDQITPANSPTRKASATDSGVLLAFAGYTSLCLLGWQYLLVPALPSDSSLKWLLATLGLCCVILTVLFRVATQSAGQDRYLAGLLAIFPLAVLFSLLLSP